MSTSYPLENRAYHSEKAFKDYWRKLRIWKYFNHMISFFVLIYILEKVLSNWTELKDERQHLIRVGISTVVLMVLPFIDTVQFRQLTLTATACILIISIINLEQVFRRHQSFVTLYFIMISHRLLQFRTFYDNFALCISYSADVSSLGHGEGRWYITSNLFLWCYFWIVWYFQNAFKRNSFRIWEHLQVLIVFKEKQEMEIKRREEIVKSHFHPDLLRHLFPSDEERDKSESESQCGNRAFPQYVMSSDLGCSIDSKLSAESGKPSKGRSPFLQPPTSNQKERSEREIQGEAEEEEEAVFLFAKKEGLLSSYKEQSVCFDQLQHLNGLDRRNASLIAVKIEKGEAEECAFVVDREQNLHQMMDILAQKYKITSIRRFGNVWIGVSGFFRDPKPKKGGAAADDSRPHSNTSSTVTGEQREMGLRLDRANSKVKTFLEQQQSELNEEEKLDSINNDLDQVRNFDQSGEVEKESMSLSMEGKDMADSKGGRRVTIVSRGKMKYPDSKNPFQQQQQLPFTQTKGKEKSVRDADAMYDCLRSIQFCSELRMILLQCGFRMTAAIDYGNILGGFVKSPHFDLFGQEVRWILKTVELQEYGVIMVSDQVKEQFHTKSTKDEAFPEFQRADSEYPWKKDSFAKITVLTNGEKLLRKESVGDVLMKRYQVQSLEELPEVLLNSSWFANFDEASYLSNIGRRSNYGNANRGSMIPITTIRKNPKKGGEGRVSGSFHQDDSTDSESAGGKEGVGSGDSDGGSGGENKLGGSDRFENWWSKLWLGYVHFMYWYEDLGTEFKLSIKDRWNVDFNDGILQKYSEKELNQVVSECESKMYDLLGKVCFPDLYHLFFLHSTYQKDMQQIEDQNLRENSLLFPYVDVHLAYQSDVPLFSAPYSDWTMVFSDTLKSFLLLFHHSVNKALVVPTIHEENELDQKFFPKESKLSKVPHLESQDTLRSISYSSEVNSTRFYDAFYRPWSVYIQDARLFCHINPLNLILEILIFCGVWFAIVPLLFIREFSWTEAIFLNIFILYCIISRQLDKQYERIGNYVLIGCMALLFILFPCYLLREIRESQYRSYGDWGGDVSLMLIFALRIPNCMRQAPWVSLFEGFFIRILLAIVRYGGNNCNLNYSAMFTTIVICVALLSYYCLLQYRCYLSYLLEHHLLYYSAQKYEEEKLKTSNLFIYFHPQLTDLGALYTESQKPFGQIKVNQNNYHHHFHFRQIYRNTAVAAVHLKVADIGSTILEPRDFLKLIALLQENIQQIFDDFGVLRLTNFSGMFMAVVNKSHNNEVNDGSMRRGNVNHNLQVLYLLKRLQRSMERFSIDHNFNVSMGVSVNSGNVYLGFLGNRQACFDASGVSRDVSMIMASHSSENGMYIAREFESLLPSIIPNPENHVTRHFTSDDRKYGFYWLKFDGTVSGIQLQDFTYIGMLGKGGYGSVHLVTEKYTNINLAVKVIVLKNSVMSRMIKRECIILQKMQHPNIVKFLYSFLSNNRLYLVMKYVTGGNLKQVIERDRPSLLQLRIWFAELISAVEYIHNVGILHRDIKPANCMISDQGYLQLADFGLSKSIKRHPFPQMSSPRQTVTLSPTSWTANMVSAKSEAGVVESQIPIPRATGSNEKTVTEKDKERERGSRLLVNGRSATLGRLDVSNEMREKLASFFPLKSHLTGGEGKATTVKALVVNSAQGGKEEAKQVHTHFTIGVCRANRVDAELILTSMNVDSVFIEFNPDDNIVEVCEMIKDIRATSRNTTPVYVLTVYYQANSREFIECGAEECFEKDFSHLDEEVFARIFNIASYDYQKNSSYQMENSNRHKPVRSEAADITSASLSETKRPDSLEMGEAVGLGLDLPQAIGSSVTGAVEAIAETREGRRNVKSSAVEAVLTPARSSSPVYFVGMAEKAGDDRNVDKNMSVTPVAFSEGNRVGNSPLVQGSNYRNSQAQMFSFKGNEKADVRAKGSVTEAGDLNMQQQAVVGGAMGGGGGGVSDSDEKEHIVGTIHFIAPEILRSHYYSVCSDWWACGITFYYCIVRKHLFGGEDRSTIFHNILQQEVDLSALDEHEKAGNAGVKDLIGGLLQKDIRYRYGQYGTDVLIKHPFFKEIRWDAVPVDDVNRLHPKHFALKKFNLADKATFYGDTNPISGGSNTGSMLMGNTNAGANNNNNQLGSNGMGNGVVGGEASSSLSTSSTSVVGGGTGMSSTSYYNREMHRKISYNKMKMDLRNDYLLNRFKTLKSRLRDYRKRRMQHYSIKHEKKQRLEKGNGFRNDENARMSSYRASLELDPLDNDPNFYEFEQMSSFASSGYYSSRENAQLQYISQQQMISESLSPSEHSDSSFYSDKTIQEEENEDEEEEDSSRMLSGVAGTGGDGLMDEEGKEELDHAGRLLGMSVAGGEEERNRLNGYYGSSNHEKGARHRYDRGNGNSQNNSSTGSNSNNTSDSQGGKSGSDGESRKVNRSRKNSLKRSGRSLSGGMSRSSNDRSETSSGSGSNSNTGERGGSGSQSRSRSRSRGGRLSRQSSGKNSVAKVREFEEDNEGEGYEYGGDDEYDGLDYLEEMKNRSIFELKGEGEEEEKLYLEEIEKSLEKEEIENDKSMSIPI